jgi:hypothetical protein
MREFLKTHQRTLYAFAIGAFLGGGLYEVLLKEVIYKNLDKSCLQCCKILDSLTVSGDPEPPKKTLELDFSTNHSKYKLECIDEGSKEKCSFRGAEKEQLPKK